MSYRKLVIIGAGRSGTNMLRDALTSVPGVATWPCDEINYVWRHGNRDWPDDEIPASRSSARVRRFINHSFDSAARRYDAAVLVEKTCANSLRVPFVNAVVPDARYVFIVRDGRDVVASAMKRWTGTTKASYIMQKARFVPYRDIPHYGVKFASNYWTRWRSDEGRLGFWGPRFHGFDDYVSSHSLAETCAMQWVRSVELARDGLSQLPPGSWMQVRYEDLVTKPDVHLHDIAEFADVSGRSLSQAADLISASNVGKWKTHLGASDRRDVAVVTADLLKELRYRSEQTP